MFQGLAERSSASQKYILVRHSNIAMYVAYLVGMCLVIIGNITRVGDWIVIEMHRDLHGNFHRNYLFHQSNLFLVPRSHECCHVFHAQSDISLITPLLVFLFTPPRPNIKSIHLRGQFNNQAVLNRISSLPRTRIESALGNPANKCAVE